MGAPGWGNPPHVTSGTRLAEAIAAEKLDESLPRATAKCKRTTTNPTNPTNPTATNPTATNPTATNPTDQIDTNTEDQTFTISVSEGGSESSDDDTDSDGIEEIGNEEVADMLPSKTIPNISNRKGHMLKPKTTGRMKSLAAPARKKARTSSDEVEVIKVNTTTINTAISPISSPQKNTRSTKKSLIYLFYEIIANGSDGTLGDDGDVHYHCLHGVHKVCTIKKSMRSNLNVLVNNLCIHIKPMYQLYCILKDWDKPPTPDEINSQLDAKTEAEYLWKLEQSSQNIRKAFQDQKACALGPFNQETFKQLLMEWIITCDQPFDKVEKPEFTAMMNSKMRWH
ncbi:hypothetical protein DFH94DRAFT_792116 [Russula ochroleuca]|uniref:Uncharacterized protein n=1 Tax=Russula ochroleuca TaxID=152965 RepID=A0A9P5N3H2_9AGAM|nr:hypothetical protein DFH94DRAFT_792116 [Russula ochroleuca]